MAGKAGKYLRSAVQTLLIVAVLFVIAAALFGNGNPLTDSDSPSIEVNGTTDYAGELSGSGGPTGVPLDGEIRMSVSFNSGKLTGTVEGERLSNGTLDGTVNPQTGDTSGTGALDAFGLSGVSFEFEGEFTENGSRAEGTWETKPGSEINGDGTWRVEGIGE
jgi:hypothetical protein